MAGAYCKFCDRRCFLLRVMPADARWRPGEQVHLATCSRGAQHDREATGYDHTTAINPLATEDAPPARQFCRKCLHNCVPAVTLTFDNGTRRLHWCADHVADADQYRASADEEPSADETYVMCGCLQTELAPGERFCSGCLAAQQKLADEGWTAAAEKMAAGEAIGRER